MLPPNFVRQKDLESAIKVIQKFSHWSNGSVCFSSWLDYGASKNWCGRKFCNKHESQYFNLTFYLKSGWNIKRFDLISDLVDFPSTSQLSYQFFMRPNENKK